MRTFIVGLFILNATLAFGQAILRVNNTAGVNVPYTTLAAAVTAAGPTDVIMVEGSITNYGDITINKKVTIVGPGYSLNENTGLQATLQPATLNSLTLGTGAGGSTVAGLSVLAGLGSGNCCAMFSVSNLTIYGCSLQGNTNLYGAASNILIRGNSSGMILSGDGSVSTNVIVANNLLWGINGGNFLYTVTNNIMIGNFNIITNSTVRNNIFIDPSLNPNFSSSIVSNNVFVTSSASVDGTNLLGVSASSLFVGLAGHTYDTQWILKTGSPAIGFGQGGIDCGVYGGSTPYRPSGIRSGQHTITNLSVPGTVLQNGTLNVTVSAKVH